MQTLPLLPATVFLEILKSRAPLTEAHTRRVMAICNVFAKVLGLDPQAMQLAASLHDVGMLAIPDHLLLKPGPLTPEETLLIRRHVVFSARIADMVTADPEVRMAVACYHEHWDGTGYPRHLVGGQIPLMARGLALADAWDAITRERVYSAGRSVEEAAAILRTQEGIHFAPGLIEVFLNEVIKNPNYPMLRAGVMLDL